MERNIPIVVIGDLCQYLEGLQWEYWGPEGKKYSYCGHRGPLSVPGRTLRNIGVQKERNIPIVVIGYLWQYLEGPQGILGS